MCILPRDSVVDAVVVRERFNLSCAASETIRSPTRSSHIDAVRESENAFWRFLFFRVFDIGDASLTPPVNDLSKTAPTEFMAGGKKLSPHRSLPERTSISFRKLRKLISNSDANSNYHGA